MRLEEAIDQFGEILADKNHEWPCEECAEDHRHLEEWLIQLKLITELVQEYVDKEKPEKICEDGDPECWGIEATTLLGKIADILKIDIPVYGEDNE